MFLEPRKISEIKDLPISQLSDEEIVKAAMYRLDATYCAIMYRDREGNSFYIDRWKSKYGKVFGDRCRKDWENTFGNMRRVSIKKP